LFSAPPWQYSCHGTRKVNPLILLVQSGSGHEDNGANTPATDGNREFMANPVDSLCIARPLTLSAILDDLFFGRGRVLMTPTGLSIAFTGNIAAR
jgi:hypothetical protein